MLRYLNVLSVAALVGPAIFAYSIKYETMRYSAEIVKLQHSIERENDRIIMLRAEWAHLTRPGRIQALADRHLDMQSVNVDQIVKAADLPERAVRIDAIGRKLELLGLAEPTATPNDKRAGATTPTSGR
jgi:cell division protein FtsL